VIKDRQVTRHFRKSEFSCRCRRPECDAKPVTPEALAAIESLRSDWDRAMSPTSVQRCAYWNEKQGGAPESRHLVCDAFDFWFDNEDLRDAFVELAAKHGFNGIGVGKHRVHIDLRPTYARWRYFD